jgi:phosphoribosylaminoimidazolecarboxamide formyltransferase/IMP cyclohydrolase
MVEKSQPGNSGLVKVESGTGPVPGNLRKMYRTARAESFPSVITINIGDVGIEFKKVQWDIGGELKGLRYGTNPHQSAAIYTPVGSPINELKWLQWGKGGPSLTNVQDGCRGMKIVGHFEDQSVAVMKHINPSGVAISINPLQDETYVRARSADERAAFGCVVAFNSMVTRQTAEKILETFVEVVYAPDYHPAALQIFGSKKDLRVARMPVLRGGNVTGLPNILSLDGGALIFEDPHITKISSLQDVMGLAVATKRSPTETECKELLNAWLIVVEIRSNGIVFWKNGRSLGIGQGQVDRIGAIEDAILKAKLNRMDLAGSVLASDGFIPKVDNVEAIAKLGVTAIIQPGGSKEDQNVIDACNRYGIAMVFTAERAFRH